MNHRPLATTLALLAASLVAACGGGGGSSPGSPPGTITPATPSPTPTPVSTTSPACRTRVVQTTGSSYALTSNPSGIAVQRLDPTQAGCSYFSGVTPTTDIPETAPHLWQYVFAGSSLNPYSVSVSQQLNGPHTLFYNQAGDSSGNVNVSSLQAIRRGTLGTAATGDVLRRPRQRFSGAGVEPSKVMVRYRGAKMQIADRVRRLEASERTEGFDVAGPAGMLQRVVAVPAGVDTATFASRLRASQDVADVFPIHRRFALSKPALAVNDPHGNNVDQWYLFADGFPNGWSYTKGDGVKIAVIDTGIDLNNTDLTAKLDFSAGYKTTTAQDTNGHGTNTAGIAAALTNNLTGFAGAGYNVRLLAYNIFPDTTSTSHNQFADTGDEAKAIADAVARGADVISLSLGAAQDFADAKNGNGFDQTEHDAVEAAIAAGVTVVAAAGNDADGGESGTPHTLLDYPAAYDGVLAVGASALRDNNSGKFAGSSEYVTSYSQYGPGLGVVAPGGDPGSSADQSPLHWIWNYSTSTANYSSDVCKTPSPATSCTAFFAGTSQATPQVAAAAALLIAAAGGHNRLSPAQVSQLITSTADNINDPHQGHGRLNVYKALAALTGDTAAYSGPSPASTNPTQLIAFAYDNPGANKPHILDVNYPKGVPVDAAGFFRIGDVPANAGTYRVGVWYDANGDGVIDAGDQFGSAATNCNAQQKCTIGSVTLQPVTAGFALP